MSTTLGAWPVSCYLALLCEAMGLGLVLFGGGWSSVLIFVSDIRIMTPQALTGKLSSHLEKCPANKRT